MNIAKLAFDYTEKGLLPDSIIRRGIRRLLERRLSEIAAVDCEEASRRFNTMIDHMDRSVAALLPDRANAQHYEVPAAFFERVLGARLKYSCCYWDGVENLDRAEQLALQACCERAQLADGQRILELGCGWGSLTLWMAQRFPHAHITAISNSKSQRQHITRSAMRLGLSNVEVVTHDMNTFAAAGLYDRIVSVEMFEHMRNYRLLFRRMARWLVEDGKFFMHIFCHRNSPYLFEERGEADWMTRYFFAGGMMPSDDLPLVFQDDLRFIERWRWSGSHYQKTAEAWLQNMDKRRDKIWPILERTYGAGNTSLWWTRWRIFFMACAELFGYEEGEQWWISHYLFARNR
jgi:cyclopropane-fatty-acyl-phospholipid synthase